jgi:hypothetical protein
MDDQSASGSLGSAQWMRAAGTVALGLLALFLLAATVYVFQSYRFIGSGVSATNTITVTGEGEVSAVPDIATFSITIQERAEEVEDAQTTATENTNAIIAYLEEQGIEDKDIKTTGYNVYPRYEYTERVCTVEGYCPPGEQVLAGYEVSQSIEVKVRDTEKAGALLSGVGSLGASQVSGLSFTIDDEDELQADARQEAIDDAREKAETLASQLGVRLVRIVGFNESGYEPYYAYGRGGAEMAMDASVKLQAAPAPQLPTGENEIISNVTVTYEIR